MNLLAIDPGNSQSAYVVIGEDLRPIEFEKVNNDELLAGLSHVVNDHDIKHAAVEMVACYGMAVGAEVFETCVWIGRYIEQLTRLGVEVKKIYRKDVKSCLCHSQRAKDANIRQALIDRFAQHDLKNGKGTIKNKDWFYGFSKDVWAAYAVAITYREGA